MHFNLFPLWKTVSSELDLQLHQAQVFFSVSCGDIDVTFSYPVVLSYIFGLGVDGLGSRPTKYLLAVVFQLPCAVNHLYPLWETALWRKLWHFSSSFPTISNSWTSVRIMCALKLWKICPIKHLGSAPFMDVSPWGGSFLFLPWILIYPDCQVW